MSVSQGETHEKRWGRSRSCPINGLYGGKRPVYRLISKRKGTIGCLNAVFSVSWERGVGLPDVNTLEALAEALDVSLVELMQARRNERKHIPTEEAEKLLMDTIQLSKTSERVARAVGGGILAVFGAVSVLLLLSLPSSGKQAAFAVGSLMAGLAAWGIPIWRGVFVPRGKTLPWMVASFGYALLAVVLQFFSLAYRTRIGDWSGIQDTVEALAQVCLFFSAVTVLLNLFYALESTLRKTGEWK